MAKSFAAVGSALLGLLAAALSAPAAGSPGKVVCDRTLEDFTSSKMGEFPIGWRTRYEHNLEEARTLRLYAVQEQDGRRVLRGVHGTHCVTVVRRVTEWDLKKYPILQWQWRATVLPKGGDEGSLLKNDSAASVYIVWKAGFPFKASSIRYSWSTSLPVGKTLSNRFGHDRIVILESGSKYLGQWRTAQVNVWEDARRSWGDEPDNPVAITIKTDGDSTNSPAEAYFAALKLCRLVRD